MNKETRTILINNLDYKIKEKFLKKFKTIDEKKIKLKEEEQKLIDCLKEETIQKVLKDKHNDVHQFSQKK